MWVLLTTLKQQPSAVVCILKGYCDVSLIHVLTHLDTEYDPPSRDKVCGPLAYIVLASSETTARQPPNPNLHWNIKQTFPQFLNHPFDRKWHRINKFDVSQHQI